MQDLEKISILVMHKMEKYVSKYCIQFKKNNKKVGKNFPT